MKTKLLLSAAAAACMLSAASAYAQVYVQPTVQFGAPVVMAPAPVVVAPAPVVVGAYPGYGYIGHPWVAGYDPYHRGRDWRYWQERRGWDHHHHY